MRVTDEMVEGYLIWGRNYGEIDSFRRVSESGRTWLVKLPAGATVTASNAEPGPIERRIVPDELVLTSREALAFGMGLRWLVPDRSQGAHSLRENGAGHDQV